MFTKRIAQAEQDHAANRAAANRRAQGYARLAELDHEAGRIIRAEQCPPTLRTGEPLNQVPL